MGNVEGSHIWKHAHAVWKEILNTAGGRGRKAGGAPRALGGQSEKTEGWSLVSLRVGFFFFFPSTCGSWCQEQNLKSQNFIEFSFGIQKNLFDFSSPSLFFLSHVFPLRIFISTHMPQRGSSYHLEKYAFLTFWKEL